MSRQHPAQAAQADEVRRSLTPVMAGLGLVLEDVVLTPAGGRLLLRVVLDVAPEVADAPGRAALSLDDVAHASRAVSDVLDGSVVMGEAPYTLEVTTPGVDRPLVEPRHFRRNVRRLVAVRLTDGGAVQGRITAVDEAGLALTVPGPKKGMVASRTLTWGQVRDALVQVEFSRSAGAPAATDEADDDVDDEPGADLPDENGD